MRDFYTFMVNFMQVLPQYRGRDLYIVGEGYAGHFVPIFARVLDYMKNEDLNLKGVALGNAWVDPFY